MVTKFDKALVGLIVPLVLYFINWLARNYGMEVTPEVQAALETVLFWLLPVVTGALVWLVPNKKADEGVN